MTAISVRLVIVGSFIKYIKEKPILAYFRGYPVIHTLNVTNIWINYTKMNMLGQFLSYEVKDLRFKTARK